jgi:hypothetical protein
MCNENRHKHPLLLLLLLLLPTHTWHAYTSALNAMKMGRSDAVGMLRAWW